MPESTAKFSGYRAVWVLVMFDLPVVEPEDRKNYQKFRAFLLAEGFNMLQFSVYARFFGSDESAEPHRKKVKINLPPDGKVRILTITDKQFGKIENYIGKSGISNEKKPDQLALF